MKFLQYSCWSLLIALIVACSSSQEDGETLEVSAEGNQAANNQEFNDNQGGFLNNDTGNVLDQGSQENGSIAGDNLTNDTGNTDLNNNMGNSGAGMATDFVADGSSVVRYVVRDQTNVYQQADSSSAVVTSLAQGEVLLVTISGEFAQSTQGFIAVSDLSADMQPFSYFGNDWR